MSPVDASTTLSPDWLTGARDLWPYAVVPDRHPIEGTAVCAERKREDTMKHANNVRHQVTPGRRSSRTAVNPYFIEDIAMTPSELARARTTDVSIVVPRQL
jgi:hypothetical protein